MKHYFNITHSLIVAFAFSSIATAQVSIGDTSVPASGALLQLKENNEIGVNSTRGLLMPRVKLTNSTELYPIFEDGYPGHTTEEVATLKQEHTGITVYVPELFGNNECPGLYIWDGKKWDLLGKQEREPHKRTEPDGEGNTYSYKRYGDYYWMTQNIRSMTVNGSGSGGLESNMTDWTTANRKKVTVGLGNKAQSDNIYLANQSDIDNYQSPITSLNLPKGMHAYRINGVLVEIPLDKFITKFGLMYSYNQALQACPTGWTLPSHTIWQELKTELIALNGGNENTLGLIMKNDDSEYRNLDLSGNPAKWTGPNPCDYEAINSEFNALPTGYGNQSRATMTEGFGASAGWWASTLSSSSPSSPAAYRYRFQADASANELNELVAASLQNRYNVRCVRKVPDDEK